MKLSIDDQFENMVLKDYMGDNIGRLSCRQLDLNRQRFGKKFTKTLRQLERQYIAHYFHNVWLANNFDNFVANDYMRITQVHEQQCCLFRR